MNTQDQLEIVSQDRIQLQTVVEDAQKIIKKTMQGKKLDPGDDQSNKGESGDQTGRDSSVSVLSDKLVEVPTIQKVQQTDTVS